MGKASITANAPLRDRLIFLDAETTALDTTIANRESALNTLICCLYDLTWAKIAMVENGGGGCAV